MAQRDQRGARKLPEGDWPLGAFEEHGARVRHGPVIEAFEHNGNICLVEARKSVSRLVQLTRLIPVSALTRLDFRLVGSCGLNRNRPDGASIGRGEFGSTLIPFDRRRLNGSNRLKRVI